MSFLSISKKWLTSALNLGRRNPDGTSMRYDAVHLGSKGIALFCMNIKQCIIKPKSHLNDSFSHENPTNQSSASKYPYWTPNNEYRQNMKAPAPTFTPWTGDHNWNFNNQGSQLFESIQPFPVNINQNGYQS